MNVEGRGVEGGGVVAGVEEGKTPKQIEKKQTKLQENHNYQENKKPRRIMGLGF